MLKTAIIFLFFTPKIQIFTNFAPGGMAEWSNAAVLKTVVPQGTGGSNPSSSAQILKTRLRSRRVFLLYTGSKACLSEGGCK